MSKLDLKLSKSFQYSHDGELKDAKTITLLSPKGNHLEECLVIEEHFVQAIKELQDSAEETGTDLSQIEKDDNKDPSSKDVFNVFAASKCVSLFDIVKKIQKLLINGCAFIDNTNTPVIERHFELMSIEDTKFVCGEFLVNFVIASLLADQD